MSGTKVLSYRRRGKKVAVQVIRKHRLWEYFLVEKLHFGWDEVHEMAEELEHISSRKLIDRLDDFLGNPQPTLMAIRFPTARDDGMLPGR